MRRSSHDTESEEHLSAVDFALRPTEAELAAARSEIPIWAIIVGLLIALGGAFGWALLFTAAGVLADLRREAIKHGAARYHQTTGDFKWLPRSPTPPIESGTSP